MAGLYVHIPFCIRKCAYCDFLSFSDSAWGDAYLVALKSELCARAGGGRIDTVFFGGGTPSVLPNGKIAELSRVINQNYCVATDAERTIELNPGTADARKLEEYKNAGFNRLSIGAQSLDDSLLASIGRIHDSAAFYDTFELARKAGFDNINADIIYALPGQSVQQHIDTVKKLIALGPEHISMYALILEDGTPLARAVKRGETQLPNEDETIEMAKHAQALLEQAGYFRYEISNYAKAGRTSHHNINYWENGEYIGVGLGAHSAFRDGNAWLRRENTASMDDYIMNAVNSFTVDRIEYEEELFESVMLGLRMTRGIDRKRFEHRFGTDIVKKFQTSVSNLGKNGLLEVDDSAVRLTEKGLDVQNSVLMAFMEYTK